MPSPQLADLIARAAALSHTDRLRLIAALAQTAAEEAAPDEQAAPLWRAARGSAPYPLAGMDAQEYVNRSRAGTEPKEDGLAS
jgi:hypothetical protein